MVFSKIYCKNHRKLEPHSAIFDGDTLSLYTNGTVNSKFSIAAANLERESHTSTESELVDSTSDVIIGATSDMRVVENTHNNFYGSVDKFAIYDELLNNEQILQIYKDTLFEIENKSSQIQLETIETEQEPVDLLNIITNSTIAQTGINATQTIQTNSTLDTNSTEFIVVPQFDTTNTFTLSVWITPDYTKGSDEFTIFAKEKAFMLSLNNVINPQFTPKFSIFDGMRWTDVVANAKVQGLTHLAVVVNATDISLYVNGILERQATLSDSISIIEGKSTLVPSEIADSDSSIVIGAYLSTLRSEPQLSNRFAGIIDEPKFFNTALDKSQIDEIFRQKIQDHYSIQTEDLVTIRDMANMTFNTTQYLNTTINLNVTMPELIEIPIVPQIDSMKSTYLITENPEFELELFDDTLVILKQKQDLQIAINLLANTTASITQKDQNITNKTDSNPADNVTHSLPFFGWMFFIPQASAEQNTSTDLEVIKQEIQDLHDEISNIDTDDKTSKEKISNAIETIKDVTEGISDIVQGSDDLRTDDDLQRSLEKIKEITKDTTQTIQEGKWIENGDTITTEIYDPNGSVTKMHSAFEKIRDGKFKITLSADHVKQPGLYKIKTIITVDGEQYISENEFAWGLVSLNTQKSIYKPGETADFIIVVLDNEGHPVCDANILMTIQSNNTRTALSTGNGITPDAECGLYSANYKTSEESTYSVDIIATSSNINASFSTTFDVKSNYEFDIIRTAQSKLDPVSNPNSFTVKIAIESFVNTTSLHVQDVIPAIFEVTTDADIQTVGDQKILTWNVPLNENKGFVEYSYSIPLKFPRLYALGPIEIHYNSNQIFREARPWFVAADPPIPQGHGGLLVYSDGTTGTPKYRIFDDPTFVAEGSATSVGAQAIEWIRVAASPTKING